MELTAEAGMAAYDGVGGASLAGFPGLAAGTQVATPAGPVAVEKLRPGDTVRIAGGHPASITRVEHRRLTAETLALLPAARPVRLQPSALGHLLPRQKLLLAPDQVVIAGKQSAPLAARIGALVNGLSISRRNIAAVVTYVRLHLATPGAILAAGLPCVTDPRPEVDPDEAVRLQAWLAALAGLRLGPLDGNVAKLLHDRAEGWTMDRDHPDLPVPLEMLMDGEVVARTLADRRRPDLEMAGLGNGHCGFAFRLRRPLPAHRDLVVQLRRIGDGTDVPGSPLLLRRARGDAASLLEALRTETAAATGDPARDALASFLATGMDLLLQARVERPAMPKAG